MKNVAITFKKTVKKTKKLHKNKDLSKLIKTRVKDDE
jgi:hypothetical protein